VALAAAGGGELLPVLADGLGVWAVEGLVGLLVHPVWAGGCDAVLMEGAALELRALARRDAQAAAMAAATGWVDAFVDHMAAAVRGGGGGAGASTVCVSPWSPFSHGERFGGQGADKGSATEW